MDGFGYIFNGFWSIFDLFGLNSNIFEYSNKNSIESGSDLINFVVMIQYDSKNLDLKSGLDHNLSQNFTPGRFNRLSLPLPAIMLVCLGIDVLPKPQTLSANLWTAPNLIVMGFRSTQNKHLIVQFGPWKKLKSSN